jgi:hypothetical protein
MFAELKKYFDESLEKKRGITFYVRGNIIDGVVLRVIEDKAVEVRNQAHSKIIIMINSIDGIAMN